MLHLDVKPDNVLINTQGQVKVVDFGLARLADGFGFGVATGGTIGYMPPEQMEREELDERCDQWALASLTYEMLARGENPFRASSIDEALDKIYDAEIVIPSLLMEGIGEDLDDAIFRALDPDKEGRYPSVHSFARDAKPALGNPKQGVKKLGAIVSEAIGANTDDAPFTEDLDEEERALENEEEQAAYPLNGRWARHKEKQAARQAAKQSRTAPAFFAADDAYDEGFSEGTPIKSRYSLVLRILALLACVLISSVAFSNFSLLPGWESPALWGALLIVAVAAFAIPHLGALIAFALLGFALVNNNAILVGSLVVVATFIWWFFIGRNGSPQADAILLSTCASSISLGSLAPFICGYFLRPAQAFLSALFAAFLSLVLAGLGSVSITSWDIFQFGTIHMWTEVNNNILTTMQSPMTWAIIGSWLISAPLVSLFFSRGTTGSSLIGVACATAIVCVLPALVSSFLLSHAPDPIYLLLAIASGLIMAALAVLFPPRHERGQ